MPSQAKDRPINTQGLPWYPGLPLTSLELTQPVTQHNKVLPSPLCITQYFISYGQQGTNVTHDSATGFLSGLHQYQATGLLKTINTQLTR